MMTVDSSLSVSVSYHSLPEELTDVYVHVCIDTHVYVCQYVVLVVVGVSVHTPLVPAGGRPGVS